MNRCIPTAFAPSVRRQWLTLPPRRRARGKTLAAVVSALLVLLLASGPGVAAEYRFGPDDRLRLSIFEWRPSRDETFAWEALNDDYTIGAGGDLSLPLLGRVQAAGLTRDELALHIGEQMSQRMGLGRQPTVAIEVVEYRPFYIVGPVATAGAFPYRPGLTVLQAVSLAGGLRTYTGDMFDTGRSTINATGELDVLRLKRDDLKARVMRLEAELARADEIAFPAELLERRDEPAIATLLQAEQRIFSARDNAYSTQMRALDQLKRNLETELPSLAAQLETVETQVRLIEEELDGVTKLLKSGLADEPRRMALERELARTEGERLRVESRLLRARQEISRAEISIVELRSRRAQDITAELGKTQANLEELGRRIQTATKLVSALEAASPYVIDEDTPDRVAEPVYHIVRRVDDGMTEVPADEATLVHPGDTVKVSIRLVRTQGSPATGSSAQMSSRER